ncbi:MAG TPA: uroporphyrinogen-III synthase [Candidatus Cybelea sp.]|nr:uroporphyrinogen-III synthase [Candidatus Cybelea sp.]
MRGKSPLSGKAVVLTRAYDQASELVSAIEAEGARVLLFPLVGFAPPADWGPLDTQLARLDSFGAILFLSKNAVRYVAERSRTLGIGWDFPPARRPLLAAVGRGTEQTARREGMWMDYVAQKPSAASLVRELGPSLAGRHVLVPRSDRGDEVLPRALEELGAEVTQVIAYRTTAPEHPDRRVLRRIRRAEVDALLFSSPSAFQNLCALIPLRDVVRLSSKIGFAAIGGTTARAMREAGVRVEIEAREPSAAGVASALARYYRSPAVRRRT